MNAVPDLTEMLTVIDSEARTHEDIFTGPALPTPHGRTFGGQVLGQALAAAAATAPNPRELHSMHGYFIRPGDSKRTITFEVARLHDGHSFSARRVQAYQDGEVLMSLITSFQEPETSFEHQEDFDMSGIAGPETLPTVWEQYGHLGGDGRASWMLNRPFDFRYVESDIVLRVAERTNRQLVWMRSREAFPHPQLLHSAALAFASDYLLIEPVMRQHGVPWVTPGVRTVSLDHAMWFHRPFRVDEWLLYALDSPTAQGGRGLSRGRFYTRDGVHVASVAQECVVRVP